jgi:cytochrome c biogenesis protein CcdA
MLALALFVFSIGIADSINPSTLVPALFLASGKRGLRQVVGFTFGVFAVSYLGGALIALGPGKLVLDALPHLHHREKHIAEIVIGCALLALAAGLWAARGRVADRLNRPRGRSGGATSSFLLGAGIMAVELPTAFPYFTAIAAVLASEAGRVKVLILLLVFNLAFVLPLLAIVAIRAFAGPRAIELLDRAGVWMRRHAASMSALLLAGLGLVAIGAGVRGFV